MEKEIWRAVEELPHKYEVSNFGKVRNVKTGHILTPRADKDGYTRVNLINDEKRLLTRFVHRLMAIAFIPNPDELPVINHKDEVKDNNSLDNLEWCTHKYNSNYGTLIERRTQTYKKRGIKQYKYKIAIYDENLNYVDSLYAPEAAEFLNLRRDSMYRVLGKKEPGEICSTPNSKYLFKKEV